MKYEKCCRNCEYDRLASCKGCATFGKNAFENFELRDELAKIENGTLIELPCKVGDTVWVLNDRHFIVDIFEMKVEDITIEQENILVGGYYGEYINFSADFAFKTKETAEARLKELQEQKK